MSWFDEKPRRAYLGGPMSWLPQFNIPAFDAAAQHLREEGWDIVSPAELDSPTMREAALQSPDGDMSKLEKAAGETWGDVLARDVKIIADQVEAIVLLPGWADSRGAVLETTVGLLCKHRFYLYDKWTGAQPVPVEMIRGALFGSKKL